MSSWSHFEKLRKIFLRGVDSVKPVNMFSSGKWLKIEENPASNAQILKIRNESFDLTGKSCHLIGFGKAVLGMAVQVENILSNRLKSGIISIPSGTRATFLNVDGMNLRSDTIIKVFEGAQNNLPDENAMNAAVQIQNVAKSVANNDILLVLISGGGSALLPLPVPGLSLKEKTNLIKDLSSKGATIQELNTVRIALSDVKGGKLGRAAQNAHRTISFIISDIIGDPIDLIASGPTINYNKKENSPADVLDKFGVEDPKIRACVENFSENIEIRNGSAYIIANNKTAVDACLAEANAQDYIPIVLSTTVQGEVTTLAEKYIKFLLELKHLLTKQITAQKFAEDYPFDEESLQKLLDACKTANRGKSICLILAGEPTVKVSGHGLGGRSQELALRMSLGLYQHGLKEVHFLSAGTDGIDGPTNAAGAMGSSEIVETFLKNGGTLAQFQDFINSNDSYNFYRQFLDGRAHILTGHTSTNVMDIHLIAFSIPKCE